MCVSRAGGLDVDMITGIRPTVSQIDSAAPAAAAPRLQGGAVASACLPAPAAEQLVQPVAPKFGTSEPQFMAARASVQDSAAIAAEAAREAYIKASIAAGINPLPVP